MPLSITPLREGDIFDASSLNTLVSAVTTALNDVEMTDIADEALTENHLPDLSFSSLFPSGYNARNPWGSGANDPDGGSGTRDEYECGLDNSGGAGTTNYQTFTTAQASGDATAPYGPTSGPDEGWAIVALGGFTANAAEVSLASGVDLATSGQPNYLLCRGSVGIFWADGEAGFSNSSGQFTVTCAAIGWEDDLGSRYIVEDSIRFIDVESYGQRISVMAVIDATEVATGNGDISEVFLAVTCVHRGLDDPAATTLEYDFLVDFYSLTVTPILAGSL